MALSVNSSTHGGSEHAAMRALGYGGLCAAGLALAPIVIPAVTSNPMIDIAGASAIDMCSAGGATGLAGGISHLLAGVPLIGATLAAGGFGAVAIAAAITVGGLWLANRVDRNTPHSAFRWGSVIRWAALTTSVLISLPILLPAMSMGLNFFSAWLQPGVSDTVLNGIAGGLGKLGSEGALSGASMAAGGAGMGILHLLTCALPLGLAGAALSRKKEEAPSVQRLSSPDYDGRMQLLRARAQAA